ncbi:YceI family protein [Streptomyces lincolnensis]|uniref:YceI family protein n=1 Tax=Streptomyces lincolnensis TaxID=1915 RepID=UPI001E61764B|nr:YceI family protein [Streptomyces lincolnensis]MCD7438539.1 YceI family protein [Streptomyces lincolnensis]
MSTAVPYTALTGVYTIDPAHSTIGFSVRHAVIANVRGRFAAFEGLVKLDGTHPTRSEAYLSIQSGSLSTGTPDRDARLLGPDFLDAATYPLMAFRSVALADHGEAQFRMSGYLRIKDVELPLHMDLEFGGAVRDDLGRQRVGFSGTAIVRRSDWGLGWSTLAETGGALVSDKVKLSLDVSAVQPSRADAA